MNPIKNNQWLYVIVFFGAFFTSFAIQAELRNVVSSNGNKYDELGQQFTMLVSEHDFIAADKLVNYDAYSKRVARIVFDSTRQQTAFTRGFMGEIERASYTEKLFLAALAEPTTFKYLGTNKRREPVLRIDFTSGGHEYVKLIVRPNGKGEYLINDFAFATSGELSSVGVANATKYLVQPAESILKRLLGGVEPNKKLLAAFKKVGELRLEGKSRQAYALIQTFPDKLKNEREFVLMSIGFASAFDDAVYRTELSRLDNLYGDDPRHAFMLIDHYFYQENWSQAINAIEASKQEWGDDGALNILMSEMLMRDGQLNAAIIASERAIELEPDNEVAYWSALTVYNQAARFDDVVNMLMTLKEQYLYDFKSKEFVEDPEYSELVASDVFKAWVSEN